MRPEPRSRCRRSSATTVRDRIDSADVGSFDRNTELLTDFEVLLADREEHRFFDALLARHARALFGCADDLGRQLEIVREEEADAIGGEIDRRDPLLQVERRAGLNELGDETREALFLDALEIGA